MADDDDTKTPGLIINWLRDNTTIAMPAVYILNYWPDDVPNRGLLTYMAAAAKDFFSSSDRKSGAVMTKAELAENAVLDALIERFGSLKMSPQARGDLNYWLEAHLQEWIDQLTPAARDNLYDAIVESVIDDHPEMLRS